MRPPAYYFLKDVQKAMGWWKPGKSARIRRYNRSGEMRTARILAKHRLLLKRCGRLVTTHDLLLTELPEAASRLADDAFELVAIERRRR